MGGSSLVCKEGCSFSIGWCMREPFSSAFRNVTFPTLPSPACSYVYMLGMYTFYIMHIYNLYVCSDIVPE